MLFVLPTSVPSVAQHAAIFRKERCFLFSPIDRFSWRFSLERFVAKGHVDTEMKYSKRKLTRRDSLALMTGACAALLTPSILRAERDKSVLRVAISTETLAGTNTNDARAAYRTWIDEYDRQAGKIVAEVVPGIFIPSEELIRGVHQGMIDCYGVTAIEFAKLYDLTDPDTLALQDYLADGMEYVLLVHTSSPYRKLADLKGAQVLSLLHRDMVLLDAWLNTLLANNDLPPADRFFGSNILQNRVNQVVLPVFFHRADGACLSRKSWDTAVELNPQLGRDLRALAVSPKIIPIAIGFRRGCDSYGRKMLIDSMLRVGNTPSGRQMASLFQSHGFITRPTSVMKGTLEMVGQYERITAQQPHARKIPS